MLRDRDAFRMGDSRNDSLYRYNLHTCSPTYAKNGHRSLIGELRDGLKEKKYDMPVAFSKMPGMHICS